MAGKHLSGSMTEKQKKKNRQYELVFRALSEPLLPRGYVSELRKTTGLKASTLYGWRAKLLEDREWRPFRCHYGQHRRHFTPDEEAEIIRRIQSDWLNKGLFYSDQDFVVDMKGYYEECLRRDEEARRTRAYYIASPERLRPRQGLPPEPPRRPKCFSCSSGFIRRFRRRHKISLRRPTMKRRPTAKPEDIIKFRDRVCALEDRYPRERIFNMDETNFHLVNMKHLTWAATGADSVNCYNENDVKANVTALATINREGGSCRS